MFDEAAFRQLATQFRDFGADYAALGLTSDQAAGWANRGFLPSELGVWRDAGFGPERASFWANKYNVSPDEARRMDGK
jgi:hypothetical protein